MLPEEQLRREDFAELFRLDEQIAEAVRAAACVHCGGAIYVANYQRKPRGAAIGAEGEEFTLRHSLCCGREGCRKRTLPPSVRFLGRRVYLEIVVLAASLCAQAAQTLRAAREATRVPVWTLRRWLTWWQQQLRELAWWRQLRAQFAPPPPEEKDLPRSLVARLRESSADLRELTWLTARCLAPGTTQSPIDVARFVRGTTHVTSGA
jgi:hypothetical protein